MGNNKICVVCGRKFYAPPSSKKITCSKECSAQRKSQTHTGKTNQWPDHAKQKLKGKGKTKELTLGTPAAQQSPISGPFETNQEAKNWWLQNLINGQEYEVTNLKKFCRDNPELFEPDRWENAYAGLRQVQAWLIGRKPRVVSRWKDWTLTRPAEEKR